MAGQESGWDDADREAADQLRALGVEQHVWNRLSPADRAAALESLTVVRKVFQTFTTALANPQPEPAVARRGSALLRRTHRTLSALVGPRSLVGQRELEERARRARLARAPLFAKLTGILGEDRAARRYLLEEDSFQRGKADEVNDELETLGFARVCKPHHIKALAHLRVGDLVNRLLAKATGVKPRRVRRAPPA